MSRLVLPDAKQTKKTGKQFGSFDGLDNRRGLWQMLERLSLGVAPEEGCRRRREFLKTCAAECRSKCFPSIIVNAKVGTTPEVYWCVVALATAYELDLERTAGRLERWLSRLGR